MFKMAMTLIFCMSSSFAFAENIKCNYSVNGATAIKIKEFTVIPFTKELYVDGADYRFYISNKGHSKFELEIFDANAPSRSYAAGFLRTSIDELSWAFWSRDVLIQTACTLIN